MVKWAAWPACITVDTCAGRSVPTAAEMLDQSLIWARFSYDLRRKMVSVSEHLSGFA